MTQRGSGCSATAAFSGSGLDAILSYKSDEQDLYQLMGCDPSSSMEQLQTEYKVRALQLHPDKNPGDAEAEGQFQLLQFANDTLCDTERRATYDKWRRSGLSVPFRQWLGMRDRVKTSMHWATPNTTERMLPPDESTVRPSEGRPAAAAAAGESIRWGRPDHLGWRRSEGSEHIRRFRNYEI